MGCYFVTGASGLLGVNLMQEGISSGQAMTGCYYKRRVEFAKARTFSLDVTDQDKTEKSLASESVDVIIHCAAETDVDRCEEYPQAARLVNVDGTRAVARAAARFHAKLVYISTDSVFGGGKGMYTEDDRPLPLNVYARTKLLAEETVRQETDNHLIIRTNIFGWSANPRLSLAEWVLSRLEGGSEVRGFTDVQFSPVLVNHLAKIIFQAVHGALRGTFHVGSQDTVSKYEFAHLLSHEFSLDGRRIIPALSTEVGLKAARPLNTCLDSSRIAGLLGISMPRLEDDVRAFHELRKTGYLRDLRMPSVLQSDGEFDGKFENRSESRRGRGSDLLHR